MAINLNIGDLEKVKKYSKMYLDFAKRIGLDTKYYADALLKSYDVALYTKDFAYITLGTGTSYFYLNY